MRQPIVILVIFCLLVSACSDINSPTLFSKPNIDSGVGCPDNMECDYLSVPKDYSDTENDERVSVFYGVHKALKPEQRLGILLFNFGGPGGDAVWGASYMVRDHLPTEVLNHFDIVGMDPRGSGQSAFAQELTECAVDEAYNEGSCEATYQAIAPYLGSNSVVQDMDLLRKHLGEEKLNFLGYSYGTRLGALYALRFPDKVRAMILDSPMPPKSNNYLDLILGNTAGFEVVTNYRLEENTQRIHRYEDIIEQVNNEGHYTANDSLALSDYEASIMLYATKSQENNERESSWDIIKDGAFTLFDEDFAEQLQNELQLVELPLMSSDDELRSYAHFKAVVCTDEIESIEQDDYEASLSDFTSLSLIHGQSGYKEAGMCVDWPAKRDPISYVENMDQHLSKQNILIIGGQYDPATPYAWTEAMYDSFAEHASLITVNNWVNHGFSYKNNSCVDAAVNQYLENPSSVTGQLTCNGPSAVSTRYSRQVNRAQHPSQQKVGRF